ncbi:MAG: transcription-repair coupling factor, partial [Pseudomonadota bacterium]
MQKLSANLEAQLNSVAWSPALPGPREGQRLTISNLAGSADAAVIAQQAQQHRKEFSVLVIICANA